MITTRCPFCHGNGRVTLFKDRDPIEGYKLAPTYTCQICEGARTLPRDQAQAWKAYSTKLEELQDAREKKDRKSRQKAIALKHSAKAKLTPAEYQAITRKDLK